MLHSQSKVKAAYDQLMQIAQELGPDARLPSVREMQNRFGFSVDTINAALREMQRQQIVYVKRGVGVFVASFQKTILLCDYQFFPHQGENLYAKLMIEEAQAYAREHHLGFEWYCVTPLEGPHDRIPPYLENLLFFGGVRGVLGMGLDPDMAGHITTRDVPIVTFASYSPHAIHIDPQALVNFGIEALTRLQCRDMAYWSLHRWRKFGFSAGCYGINDPQDELRDLELIEHMEKVARRVGLEPSPELRSERDLIPNVFAQGRRVTNRERGYYLAMDVFGTDKWSRPDSIIISDDTMTRGVIDAFEELGIKLGRDVVIATHANKNSPVLVDYEADLVLFEYDMGEITSKMFQMLDKVIADGIQQESATMIRPRIRVGRNLEKLRGKTTLGLTP